MNHSTLEKLLPELQKALVGQRFGKIFTLSRLQTAFDFRLPDVRWLFVSVEPSAPRIYLIRRRLKDLEKISGTPGSFAQFARRRLGSATLERISKIPGERILFFEFNGQNELGRDEKHSLVVQLTGRSSNLFLLDESRFILDAMRENTGEGQQIAQKYSPPKRDSENFKIDAGDVLPVESFADLSEALDIFYLEKDRENLLRTQIKTAENKLEREISKRRKLVGNLTKDLENHGEAEKWKRSGDLILANLADAARIDDQILLLDYFDENVPAIEIEADPQDSLTEAAEKYFRRYTKARNAKTEISKRLEAVKTELENLEAQKTALAQAVAENNEDLLGDFTEPIPVRAVGKSKEKTSDNFKGARYFVSADNFQILVGKGSKDNDYLTFRVAKSLDLWFHAADYPGSHVIIRNPNRLEIPNKTLLEAAQLAAFYSRAREQPKVAVNYTQRKFVGKPKGAAAGLVSLSSFKTILVEPKIESKLLEPSA